MNLVDYSKQVLVDKVHDTFTPNDLFYKILYLTTGMNGEMGEFCEKIKKEIRDNSCSLSPESKSAISKELGDIMWYFVGLCELLDLNPDLILEENIIKLNSRIKRNEVQGNGDER